jgi:tRNA/tmRNA/rRNA uracil-C5-methylase (TrmA/RlmC/RlmD family)
MFWKVHRVKVKTSESGGCHCQNKPSDNQLKTLEAQLDRLIKALDRLNDSVQEAIEGAESLGVIKEE